MNSPLDGTSGVFGGQLFYSQKYNEFIKECIDNCLALDLGQFEKLPFNNELFAIAQRNQLASRDVCLFESHRKYIDIHIVLGGAEEVDVIKVDKCPLPYESNEEHDYYLYENINCELCCVRLLSKGSISVMLYDDVHRTNINPGEEPREVTKLVIKVSKELFDEEYCYEK